MASKVILTDGTSFECKSAHGLKTFISGVNRESITFNFDADTYNLNEIYAAFSDPTKTEEIIIEEGEGDSATQYHHYDFTIIASVTAKTETVSRETNESPAVTSKLISVVLGQKTYSEKQIDAKNEEIDTIVEVLADIIGGEE
jgi:hypothetical protein